MKTCERCGHTGHDVGYDRKAGMTLCTVLKRCNRRQQRERGFHG